MIFRLAALTALLLVSACAGRTAPEPPTPIEPAIELPSPDIKPLTQEQEEQMAG